MNYKLVIFDFDGTLADTEDINFTIYLDLADRYKIKKVSKNEMHLLKKMSAFELIDHLDIKKRNLPGMIRRGRKLLHGRIENIDLCKPSMREVLEILLNSGIRLGVLTSNSSKNVNKFIDNQKLNFFSFVDNTGLSGKESKLNRIIKRYGFKKEEILYVGDEIRDIHATKHVGIDIAAVDWGYNDPEILAKHHPKYLISEPEALIDICLKAGGRDE
ncbi:MAG: HAD-IA family hydrolase [Tissierellales bacterium]|nr:HAD-IA family hydrolase [Tissierellales bacterium]MBN2826357.1 HAD-IA family hydrolase [Tissierellales bacterium]